MILVTGAAGKTGLAVLRALKKRGAKARALIARDEQECPATRAGATETYVGNLLGAIDMDRAMAGVDAIYLIAPNAHPQEFKMAHLAITAAKRAGVHRFVYHSVLYPQIEAMPHHWQKLKVEDALIQSGLDFVILQPASYMQNILPYWQLISSLGEYKVPYSIQAPFTPVDLGDVAKIAASASLDDALVGGIFPLAGPERLTSAQMAQQMEQALGREIRAVQQPLEDWIHSAKNTKVPVYAMETLSKMFTYYDQHGFAGNPHVLETLLGRPASKFSAFLQRTITEL